MKVLIILVCIHATIGASLKERANCSGICTADYTPVCGSDGVTYSNLCGLNYANCIDHTQTITKVHNGECGASVGKRAE